MNWAEIWEKIKTFFTNNYMGIIKFFAVLVIGIIVIKIVLNITKRVMNKTKMEKVTQGFLYGIIKFCLYLLLMLGLISVLGISISGIITALSAMVLAIGMALQNNISNLANGIVIISSHMFKKGDYISVDGVEGSIHDINFLFTTIMTTDNKKITIPNSTIVNSAVTNYGANDVRRVNFTFGVAYECDVEDVKKLIIKVMKSNGKVRLDREVFCRLKTLNDSSLDFFAYCWCDTEDYWDVYYYVTENVFNEFKRNNIAIPYNQLEIRQRTDTPANPVDFDKLPDRVEKQRPEEKHVFDLENDDIMTIFKGHDKSKNKKDKKHKKDKKNKDKANQNNVPQNSASQNGVATAEIAKNGKNGSEATQGETAQNSTNQNGTTQNGAN